MKRLNFVAMLGLAAISAAVACEPSPADVNPDVQKSAGKGGKGVGGTGGKGGAPQKSDAGTTPENKGGSGGQTDPTPQGGAGGDSKPIDPPLDGLIGAWQFDEGSGNKVKDSSGKGNDGQIVAGGTESAPLAPAPKWVKGHENGGIELDGKTEWVKVPSSDSINSTGTTGAVSISAWVNVTGFDQTGDDFNFILSRHETGTAFEQFGIGLLSGRPAISIHFFFAIGANTIPLDGSWHHIAGTYDGITMSIFMDGVLGSTSDVGFPISADTSHLVIGGNQNIDTVKELWAGGLDKVTMYNRALSEADVKALAAQRP